MTTRDRGARPGTSVISDARATPPHDVGRWAVEGGSLCWESCGVSSSPRERRRRTSGAQTAASMPIPSRTARSPEPARVETTPAGETARMRWLPPSLTKMVPSDDATAMALGRAKRATSSSSLARPSAAPSAKPGAPGAPATVVTRRVTRSMRRTRWFYGEAVVVFVEETIRVHVGRLPDL